ncbi:hypothetical protein LINPERHAP1_LOCUS24272, partial [Linum perenne]
LVYKLQLAWDEGHKKVELQSDSRAAIALIQTNGHPDHQHLVEVLTIRRLLVRNWEAKIQHCYREGNKSPDFLACIGHKF